MDPEAVLLKSGLDAGTAAAFLHENMLEFVDNEAMEETAQAYSYLSHAGANTLFACTYSDHADANNAMHTPLSLPGDARNLHVMVRLM